MSQDFGVINLQIFAEEKTEKATPKRRKEAREKGQVLKSSEVNTAFTLLVTFGTLKIMFPYALNTLTRVFGDILNLQMSIDDIYSYTGMQKLGLSIILSMLIIVGPILGASFLSGLIINYAQVGFVVSSESFGLKFNRINPINGFKRIFSKGAIFELFKSIVKMSVIGIIIYKDFMSNIKIMPNLILSDIRTSLTVITDIASSIALKAVLALILIAALDYFYQWRQYEKNIMMSKQEIKEEYKQTEGDPQIRSKIREKQRQMGMKRMMQDIPKADVVIVNPTHFAVALQYKPEEYEAPIVIGKGRDYLAIKIREIAKEKNIVIVENKPLAQALYSSTEIGQGIPQDLFHAVAEVLAFVYNLKGKMV